MKKLILTVAIAGLILSGCSSIKDTVWKPGRMNHKGEIRQCHGEEYDAQACGNAIFNSTVIEKIHMNQTMRDVRAIMRHDAERRRTDTFSESWGYVTDYTNREMTWITFRNGVVTSIDREPWSRD